VDLGIFDQNFRVVKRMYDKYRQINRFLEIIADAFPAVKTADNLREQSLHTMPSTVNGNLCDTVFEALTIIDFGCGKSYLTFLVYYFFTEVRKQPVRIYGYDIKADVVARCNAVAQKYGYANLTFETRDVAQIPPQPADMLIALHACDTATDYAINYAIKNKLAHIFCVPCCQHEANAQIRAENGWSVFTEHGLYKERFAALMTDAIRCKVLENLGYDVDVVELVDFANTPKNAMIRAKLTVRQPVPPCDAKMRQLMDMFHIDPTLFKLLQ
jgi:SAM-dependent methyltransferase